MSSLTLHHLFYGEEILTQNSFTFRYKQGHHLVHPSWEKRQIPGRFWNRFQRCLYSLSRLSRLLLPYPPRGFSHDSAWAARVLFSFCFSLWILTFYLLLFLLLWMPSPTHFSAPSAHFYVLKGLWLFPLGPFDLPESCSVVRMIWQEIPAVAFPPLTFFQGISFTSNQRVEPDCNLCCVINRPLTLSLSLPFSFLHTMKDQLALMDKKDPWEPKINDE